MVVPGNGGRAFVCVAALKKKKCTPCLLEMEICDVCVRACQQTWLVEQYTVTVTGGVKSHIGREGR